MWCPFVFFFAYLLTADYEKIPIDRGTLPTPATAPTSKNGGFEQWERNDATSQKWWEKKTSKMMISTFLARKGCFFYTYYIPLWILQ